MRRSPKSAAASADEDPATPKSAVALHKSAKKSPKPDNESGDTAPGDTASPDTESADTDVVSTKSDGVATSSVGETAVPDAASPTSTEAFPMPAAGSPRSAAVTAKPAMASPRSAAVLPKSASFPGLPVQPVKPTHPQAAMVHQLSPMHPTRYLRLKAWPPRIQFCPIAHRSTETRLRRISNF